MVKKRCYFVPQVETVLNVLLRLIYLLWTNMTLHPVLPKNLTMLLYNCTLISAFAPYTFAIHWVIHHGRNLSRSMIEKDKKLHIYFPWTWNFIFVYNGKSMGTIFSYLGIACFCYRSLLRDRVYYHFHHCFIQRYLYYIDIL